MQADAAEGNAHKRAVNKTVAEQAIAAASYQLAAPMVVQQRSKLLGGKLPHDVSACCGEASTLEPNVLFHTET